MSGRDTVAAAVMLLFAAAATVESARLLPYGLVRNPGPGFFPWYLGLALGVLALVLLIQSVLARPASRAGQEAGPFIKVAGVLAALALYALALDLIGYPIGTFLLVLFLLRVTERHRWLVAVGMAMLIAGGSYVVFAVWLAVPLPAGPLAR